MHRADATTGDVKGEALRRCLETKRAGGDQISSRRNAGRAVLSPHAVLPLLLALALGSRLCSRFRGSRLCRGGLGRSGLRGRSLGDELFGRSFLLGSLRGRRFFSGGGSRLGGRSSFFGCCHSRNTPFHTAGAGRRNGERKCRNGGRRAEQLRRGDRRPARCGTGGMGDDVGCGTSDRFYSFIE